MTAPLVDGDAELALLGGPNWEQAFTSLVHVEPSDDP